MLRIIGTIISYTCATWIAWWRGRLFSPKCLVTRGVLFLPTGRSGHFGAGSILAPTEGTINTAVCPSKWRLAVRSRTLVHKLPCNVSLQITKCYNIIAGIQQCKKFQHFHLTFLTSDITLQWSSTSKSWKVGFCSDAGGTQKLHKNKTDPPV